MMGRMPGPGPVGGILTFSMARMTGGTKKDPWQTDAVAKSCFILPFPENAFSMRNPFPRIKLSNQC